MQEYELSAFTQHIALFIIMLIPGSIHTAYCSVHYYADFFLQHSAVCTEILFNYNLEAVATNGYKTYIILLYKLFHFYKIGNSVM